MRIPRTAISMLALVASTGCGSDLKCGEGTYDTGGRCVPLCDPGTHLEGEECVADLSCAPGTTEVDGECVPDVTCGPGTVSQDGECVPEVTDTTDPVVTVTPDPGTYRIVPVVTITADEPAMIWYTLDGTDPVPGGAGTAGDGSPATITDVSVTTTVRYLAEDHAGNTSEIAEAVYTIDEDAPAPATDLRAVASTSGTPRIQLSWTDPADTDHGTTVILRGEMPVSVRPHDGTAYAAGSFVGPFEVIHAGTGENITDTDVVGGTRYFYAAFAADTLSNYAAPAFADAMPVYFSGTLVIEDETVSIDAPTLDAGSGGLDFQGASEIVGTDLTAWISLQSSMDRILFNPKLVVTSVTGGTLVNPHGQIDGDDYMYYGFAGLAKGGWSPIVEWEFSGVTGPVTIDFELRTDPMVFVSTADSMLVTAVDTGTHTHVGDIDYDGSHEHDSGVYFNAVTPDGRYFLASSNYDHGILVLDTVQVAPVGWIQIADEDATLEGQVFTGGIVVSPDGSSFYATATEDVGDMTGLKYLVEVGIGGTWPEMRRVFLGTTPDNWAGRLKNFAIDWDSLLAYVPATQEGLVHVVDIATMSEIDADGDSSNGVTPIHLSAGNEDPTSIAISPDGTHAYVGVGTRSSTDIPVIDLATYDVSTLTSTVHAGASGPNIQFGPDGRLYVPRTQYWDTQGISVFDLTTSFESFVTLLPDSGNNDIWDIQFVPMTTIAYASMTDDGALMPFDYTTSTPIDLDGDSLNGQTNILNGLGTSYGGAIVITPF